MKSPIIPQPSSVDENVLFSFIHKIRAVKFTFGLKVVSFPNQPVPRIMRKKKHVFQ